MKLKNPAFERAMRKRIRRLLSESTAMRKEYRRARKKRRNTSGNAIAGVILISSIVLGGSIAMAHCFSVRPGQAYILLALVSILHWLAGVAHLDGLRNVSDVYILATLPISDDRIITWHWRRYFRSFFALPVFVVLFTALALIKAADGGGYLFWVAAAAGPVAGILHWLFLRTLSAGAILFAPLFMAHVKKYTWIVTVIAFICAIALTKKELPHTVGEAMALFPANWVATALLKAMSGRLWYLLFLLPILAIVASLPALGVLWRRSAHWVEEAPASNYAIDSEDEFPVNPADSSPVLDDLPAAAEAATKAARSGGLNMELKIGRGEHIGRFVYNRLNARQQLLLNVGTLGNILWTKRLFHALAWMGIGLTLSLLAHNMLTLYSIGLIVFAGGIFIGSPILGGDLSGITRTVVSANNRVCVLGLLPISFWEATWTMIKVSLLRWLLWAPLALFGLTVLLNMMESPLMTSFLWAIRIISTLVLLQPTLISVKLGIGYAGDIPARLLLYVLPPVLCSALAMAAWFFMPLSPLALIPLCAIGAFSMLTWAAIGYTFNHLRIDLAFQAM